MRKILHVLALFAAANLVIPTVKAQLPKLPKVLAFGHLVYGNPSGDFKNISNNGLGFEVGAGLGLGKTIITGSIGQMRYNIPNGITVNGNIISAASDHLKVTPIKAGIRKYLIAGLFLSGELGVAVQKYDKYTASGSEFLYEVGAGFKFGFLEVGAGYTGFKMTGTSMNASALLLKGGLAIKI